MYISYNYLYYCSGKRWQQSQQRWEVYGTVNGANSDEFKVGIFLNMKTKKMKISVNDKDQGIAFDHIKTGKDIFYRLVVSFHAKDGVECSASIVDLCRKYL